jgi:SAM-dependent methyltransferase
VIDLQKTYHRRFEPDLAFRQKMWQILCREYFQRYVPPASRVLEIGAGYCEFINNIQAAEKFAVDLNPDTPKYADAQVRVILSNTIDLSSIPDGSIDIAFASNFFEHLERADIVATIREIRRVLKLGGKFIILQPNIRFSYRDYWMFFDHITPIDDRGLAEALEVNGFLVTKSIARFLPYSTKSSLPKSIFLLRMYLHLPLVWKVIGKQSLIIAQSA